VPLPVLLASSASAPASVWRLARDVLRLVCHWPMLCLCPLFFFSGLAFAFCNGSFPQLIPTDSIGLVLCCLGVADVAGGIVLGGLAERVGSVPTLTLGVAVYLLGLLITSTQLLHHEEHEMPLQSGGREWSEGARHWAYVAAACFGLGDAAFNTQLYSSLGQHWPAAGAQAFTAFNLLQNFGLALGFWYPLHAPMHGPQGTALQAWVQLALAGVALAGFAQCEQHFAKQRGSSGGSGSEADTTGKPLSYKKIEHQWPSSAAPAATSSVELTSTHAR